MTFESRQKTCGCLLCVLLASSARRTAVALTMTQPTSRLDFTFTLARFAFLPSQCLVLNSFTAASLRRQPTTPPPPSRLYLGILYGRIATPYSLIKPQVWSLKRASCQYRRSTRHSSIRRSDRSMCSGTRTYLVLAYSNADLCSGLDEKINLRTKLEIEWENIPLVNPQFDKEGADPDGYLDLSQRIHVVYVKSLFTDGTGFAYYIKGGVNMSRFLAGTFSGKPYDRPCFSTPVVVYTEQDIFEVEGLHTVEFDKASKTDTKGLRWKYLYESAVKAFEKLEFSREKLAEIKIMDEAMTSGTEDDSDDMDEVTPSIEVNTAVGHNVQVKKTDGATLRVGVNHNRDTPRPGTDMEGDTPFDEDSMDGSTPSLGADTPPSSPSTAQSHK
ncbi:hypothetical protein P280DRAFT_228487 [Massarina eburnea CBS 473.64]|uniref:Uncharacterized protein n=1 Tax=Massarina eburnea CBS 473.64 TaxID=1395130 RepID=A0A6A6SAK5_9PLEO|nr:hypothetical protein P280DRAFT_228487 [Massarina eburnea CBS 473.64]